MNQESVFVMLTFLAASLLVCRSVSITTPTRITSTVSPLSSTLQNTPTQTVNKNNRAKSRCIRDTLLPSGFKGICELWSEHKYALQISANGIVSGTSNMTSPNVQLELESLGKGLFIAKGVASKRYISMDRLGRLYTSKTPKLESVFKKVPAYKGFVAYRNYVHCWYIGLKRNGQPKRGNRVSEAQHSAHFVEVCNRRNK